VLSDSALFSLSRRGDITRNFPFLKAKIRAIPSGCQCNREVEKKKARKDAINDLKRIILAMNQDQKDLLKKLMRVKTLVFYIGEPTGVKRYSI
jgi:hypothetical protein